MAKKQIIVHEGYKEGKEYILMTMPLYVMSFFYYGPRVLILALVAYVTAVICDRFSCTLRNIKYDKTENSSKFFALVIVLLMPASVPFYVLVSAVIVAILIGKEAFGGYRSYPFNPAAVGICVAAVSWPDKVLKYPEPSVWIFGTGASKSLWDTWFFKDAVLHDGIYSSLSRGSIPNVGDIDLLLGNYAGPLGVASLLVIVACAVYLLVRKSINFTAPVSFILVCALIAFVFPRISGLGYGDGIQGRLIHGLQSVKYELISGIILFSAVFMVTEPGTLPKNKMSRLVCGALLGFATMMFNYFGKFEFGVCFALLLVNAISGFVDRLFASTGGSRRAKRHAQQAGSA